MVLLPFLFTPDSSYPHYLLEAILCPQQPINKAVIGRGLADMPK